MTDNTATSPPTEKSRMSIIARIIGVIISPKSTFEDIAKAPTWLVPFMLVTLVAVLLAYLKGDLIAQGQIEFMNKINLSIFTEDQVHEMAEKTRKWGWITPFYGHPFAVFCMTLLYWFSGSILFHGKAKFKMIFSVVSWSWVVSIVGWSISVSIQLWRWDYTPPLSLAFLVPRDQITFLYFVLSQIDLVYLWVIVVAGIGLAAVYKFSTTKGVSITVIWCIIYILVMSAYDMLPFLYFGPTK